MKENISKSADRYRKFYLLLMIHFPGIKIWEVEKLNCEICQDYIENYCPGKKLKGKEVTICLWERVDRVDIEIQKSLVQ